MNIEIEKQRNELLHRTAVVAKIKGPKTPSRQELLKKVAAMLGCDEKLLVIDKISQQSGQQLVIAYLKLYDNSKFLKELELNYKIKRTGSLEEKKEVKKKEE
ncbi:MAG: hypothetical protein WCX82_03700 [archaeon]|jgi:ribosomal protein S24E